jgi:hypothetical protein
MRRVIGSVLALLGGAAIVVNAFRPWYREVPGDEIAVGFLFGDGRYAADRWLDSLVLPAAVIGLLVLLAVLVQSRLLLALAGLCGAAVAVLWIVFQARANGDAGLDGTDFQEGVWSTLGGGVLLWLSAAVLPGGWRRRGSVAVEAVR